MSFDLVDYDDIDDNVVSPIYDFENRKNISVLSDNIDEGSIMQSTTPTKRTSKLFELLILGIGALLVADHIQSNKTK